jgi:SAM-dependent methyltransferase
MHPLLRRAADVLDRAGLGEPAFRVFQVVQALGGERRGDDRKLPPPYLRVLTSGVSDVDVFLRVGSQAAEEFHDLALKHGFCDSEDASVLEFGSGAGRVARWWIERSSARFYGCDINRSLVAWCSANLQGEFRHTAQSPPLPYDTGSFSLVYALSVFTHMHDENARAWLSELGRITKPGGLAVLTFLDDQMSAAEPLNARLQEGGFAVRREGAEGGNLLTSFFTPKGFAERAAPAWKMIDYVSSPMSAQHQAIAVFRRRGT